MPEIVLRATKGPPIISRREGGALVIKHHLIRATTEEKIVPKRLRGKTSIAKAGEAELMKRAITSLKAQSDIALASSKAQGKIEMKKVVEYLLDLGNKMGRQMTAASQKQISEQGFKIIQLQNKLNTLKSTSVARTKVKIEREEAQEKYDDLLNSFTAAPVTPPRR
jgi:hypothetical protein